MRRETREAFEVHAGKRETIQIFVKAIEAGKLTRDRFRERCASGDDPFIDDEVEAAVLAHFPNI